MDRRRFLKVMLAGAVAVVVPVDFVGTTEEAVAASVDLPIVDGYDVCLETQQVTYVGEPGHYTVNELFRFLGDGYECVEFEDPRTHGAFREEEA